MFGNWLKTAVLMAAIVALFGAVGALLGGGQGMLIALGLGAATNFFAYSTEERVARPLAMAR